MKYFTLLYVVLLCGCVSPQLSTDWSTCYHAGYSAALTDCATCYQSGYDAASKEFWSEWLVKGWYLADLD